MTAKSRDRRRMADILAYWHAVELFDPQDIPRPRRTESLTRRPGARCEQKIQIVPGEPLPPLPWQPGHPRHGEPPEEGWYGSAWRHTVYGGVYSFRDVRAALAHGLGYTEEEDYAGTRRDAEGALFALVVDEDGILIEDTTSFSSCAWATGRVHSPGPGAPGWLDGFQGVTGDCEQALDRLLSRPVSYLPPVPGAPADGSGDWRATVIEILGGAAAGAVAALLGVIAPVVGGVVGAGALAGAAGSIINRASQRAEREGQRAEREEQRPEREEQRPEPQKRRAEPGERSPGTEPPAAGRPVQVPDLVGFAVHVADLLGLPPGLTDPYELRVVSTPVKRKKDGSLPEPEPPFLSSPVVADLERIKDRADLGPALTSYLSDPGISRPRTDLRTDRETILNGVRPGAFPLARWPSDVGKPLAVSQQFAVNTVLADLDRQGLFSVNGPPGTGKTTLLRDLIAAIVVQRATVLAGLPSPETAFTGVRHSWTGPDGRRRTVTEPRRQLTGFEIVVASSNNNAVENITRELPGLGAIGAGWKTGAAEYFGEQATAFLGEPAWGMVAAPLGNADKRREFIRRFWWGDGGMQALLRSLEREPPPASDWKAAVDRFTEAYEAAAGLAAERAAADGALRFPIDDAAVRAARDAAGQAAQEAGAAEAAAGRAAGAVIGLQRAAGALSGKVERHRQTRPGGLRGLLGVGRQMAAWRQTRDELAAKLGQRVRQVSNAQQKAGRLSAAAATARQRAGEAAAAVDALIGRRAEGEERLRRARAAWGAAVPDNWLTLDQDRQELAAPWSDRDWTTARTRVFLAALGLHRAFAEATAGTIRTNLFQLVAALGRDPGAPPPKAELAAWQTLFMLVPVISTTFASCGRMFGTLGAGALGWLLVDEAGQAVPQHAVGALWRARRAIVVGDPLQLEPIFQVPAEVQDRLRKPFHMGPDWLPAGHSAQGLADRRNRWGTSIRTEDRDGRTEHVWVGAPLRVHRRCEEPMFGISNTIAYGGLMVYGTVPEPFPGGSRPDYPSSSWVDVTGPNDGKWVRAQGEALIEVLRRLHIGNEVALERIYVLSPFRDVVTGCQRLVRAEFGPGELAGDQVGTVHRMQGREADVVVFVLGSDPSPAKKARDWAARPANLLNVAVSRARRRLFVIGSYEEWQGAPNFGEAARMLPRHPWPAVRGRGHGSRP